MHQVKFTNVGLDELAKKSLLEHSEPVRLLVLVVDDETVIADTLAQILRQAGFAATVAYDAESALQLAGVAPPDLVISDVYMPGMSGIDLAVAISEICPDCRVLLFSGLADSYELKTEMRKAGKRFQVLQKPIPPRQLIDRISELDWSGLGPWTERPL